MNRILVCAALLVTACSTKDLAGPGSEETTSTPVGLAFTIQPGNAQAGVTLSPGVQVALQDADGNLVTAATNQVTLALGTNSTGATLGGTTEVTAVNGVATFDDLSIDLPGDGYTLTASATALTGATSGSFDISSPLLSIEERDVAFEAVQDLMATLPGDDIDADKQVVMDFLAARSEFDQVGLSDKGTIWALFNDGVPFFITDNLNTAATPGATAPHASPARDQGLRSTGLSNVILESTAPTLQQQGGPSGFPKPPHKFRLLNGFGNFFNDTDPSDEIRQMLLDRGYVEAGGDGVATVEALRELDGDAVLYFRSHGGSAILIDVANTKVDGLWTATPLTIPEPPKIFADLLKKRLGYATELNNLKYINLFGEERATHYMITDKFINHYWKNFGENSFVYFDGCWGADMPGIRAALAGKNVSVYASWTNVSKAGPNGKTAQYVFDRLLGANQFEPEDPQQRPFDYQAIKDQFGKAVPYGHDQFPSSDPNKPDIITDLEFFNLNGDFGLLAPSIKTLQVDEFTKELTIDGIFGKDPGAGKREVTIEGAQLTVKTWDEHEIVVSNFDPTAAGYVVVAVHELESNAAPLTRWEGQFTYTVDLGQMWAPTLTQQVACDLHFRADVRGYRDEPGPVLIAPLDTLFPTQSSTCEFAMFGSGTDGGNSFALTGGGPMLMSGDQSTPVNYFTARGIVDVATKKIKMSLTLGAQGEITITPPVGPSIKVASQLVADLNPLWGEPTCPPATPPVGFDFEMVSSDGFGVTSGTRPGTGPCGITNVPTVLQWGVIPAAFPPKPIDGR